MSEAPANSLAAAVEAAAGRLVESPAQAERQARAILARVPNDPRAMLILASARRRQGDAAGAHGLLAPLAKAWPRAANTHFELGASLADLGRPAEAVAALRHALDLNPNLVEAWRCLGDILFRAGDANGADAAYAAQRRAAITDPQLRAVAEALHQGQVEAVQQTLRQRLLAQPDDREALALMAEALARSARYADSEVLLARCLELDPGDDAARFAHAEMLFRQQKAAQAIPEVERLLARHPRDPAYLNLLAACLGLLGEDARIGEIYQGLLVEYPSQPKLWLNYGHALRSAGRRDEAVAAYRRCLALAPGLGDAYWSLANLKTAALGPEDEAAMLAQVARPDLSDDDRLHLHFALGKALEDRGEAEGSFQHYDQGARIRRRQVAYDAGQTSAATDRFMALFDAPFFAARAGAGDPSGAPIFVVGLPRSGSTLIEQILASHSQVEGTMELAYVELIARGLEPPGATGPRARYPECLEAMDARALAALGQRYLRDAQSHRKLGRPRFVDKMPNNFQHIGLIQLMLPNARIIDARRHPLGAGFSCFKQHFAEGQTFTYDLTDLGRYYRDYVRLMDHFDRALPGRVHRVIYEDMVEDTEGEIRRLLDYCGLPFEDQCLRFWETDRSVRTVSSEQVRQPIYRGGLDQWRAFEPWLGPLKQALGPVLEDWRGRGA